MPKPGVCLLGEAQSQTKITKFVKKSGSGSSASSEAAIPKGLCLLDDKPKQNTIIRKRIAIKPKTTVVAKPKITVKPKTKVVTQPKGKCLLDDDPQPVKKKVVRRVVVKPKTKTAVQPKPKVVSQPKGICLLDDDDPPQPTKKKVVRRVVVKPKAPSNQSTGKKVVKKRVVRRVVRKKQPDESETPQKPKKTQDKSRKLAINRSGKCFLD
jgi:hypothetical protein